MIEGKAWGTTQELTQSPDWELRLITVNPGGFCSLHVHRYKWNTFAVIDGDLSIEVHKKDYPLVDVTRLTDRQITAVGPGEYHVFRSEKGCTALEWYTPQPLGPDIERKNCGGIDVVRAVRGL